MLTENLEKRIYAVEKSELETMSNRLWEEWWRAELDLHEGEGKFGVNGLRLVHWFLSSLVSVFLYTRNIYSIPSVPKIPSEKSLYIYDLVLLYPIIF